MGKFMTVKETRVYRMIETGWCQGDDAQDRFGKRVIANEKKACTFCISSAVWVADTPMSSDIKLMNVLPNKFQGDMVDWNDARGRTQQQVLAMLVKAWGQPQRIGKGDQRVTVLEEG